MFYFWPQTFFINDFLGFFIGRMITRSSLELHQSGHYQPDTPSPQGRDFALVFSCWLCVEEWTFENIMQGMTSSYMVGILWWPFWITRISFVCNLHTLVWSCVFCSTWRGKKLLNKILQVFEEQVCQQKCLSAWGRVFLRVSQLDWHANGSYLISFFFPPLARLAWRTE